MSEMIKKIHFWKIEDDNTVSPKFLLKYILTNLLDVCIAAVKFLEMGVVNFKNPCVVTLEGSLQIQAI